MSFSKKKTIIDVWQCLKDAYHLFLNLPQSSQESFMKLSFESKPLRIFYKNLTEVLRIAIPEQIVEQVL